MNAGVWIAHRFSFARKRFRIINIISAITLVGLVLGVSTTLVVMSVLNGFQQLARGLFITLESPVQLVAANERSFTISSNLLHSLATLEGIASLEPYIEGEAMLSTNNKSELVIVKGINEAAHQRIIQQTQAPQPFFTPETIAVGEQLAYRLNLYPLHHVKLFSPELLSLGLEALSQPYLLPSLTIPEATVSSLFTFQKLFDDRYVLTSDVFARKMLLIGSNNVSGIDIRLKKGESAQRVARHIERWLAASPLQKTCRVRTLEEKYHSIFAMMQLEKWVSFSVLMLVVLVAALSLTGSLAMTAIEKQQELFYIRCLGLERKEFMAIFLIQGGMTGIAGTTIGTLLAWGICTLQQMYGLVKLPSQSAFIISAYPVNMQAGDFVAVACTAFLLSLVVSLYPARKAALIATSSTHEMKTN